MFHPSSHPRGASACPSRVGAVSRVGAAALLACCLLGPSRNARGQEAPASATPPKARTLHALTLGVGANEYDHFAVAGYRLRLPRGLQLGLETRHAQVRESFLAGYAVDQGYLGRLRGELIIPVYDDGQLWLGVELRPGVEVYLGGDDEDQRADLDDGFGVILDTGVLANLRLDPTWTVSLGARLPFTLEVAPEVIQDRVGALIVAGGNAAVADHVQLFATLETGGLFGADGDGAKYLVQGTVGTRLVFGPGAPARRWRTF
jgi:hypothetical protein